MSTVVFDQIVAEIQPEPRSGEAEGPPPQASPPEPRPDALRAEMGLLARRAARLAAD